MQHRCNTDIDIDIDKDNNTFLSSDDDKRAAFDYKSAVDLFQQIRVSLQKVKELTNFILHSTITDSDVTYSPTYRGGGFSLKYGSPYSINELSPCVPRFLCCFYANAILIPSFRMFTAAFISLL